MAYLTRSYLNFLISGKASWFDSHSSITNVLIATYSAEVNRYLDVSTNICSINSFTTYSGNTTEMWTVAKAIADAIDLHTTHQEENENLAPQNRSGNVPPDFWEIRLAHFKAPLTREKREEKPKCFNYNLPSGNITRWT